MTEWEGLVILKQATVAMQQLINIMMATSSVRLMLVFLLASAISRCPVFAQATASPPPSYNCSHRYQVSLNNGALPAPINGCVDRESCLSTAPTLNGSEDSCISLRKILELHKPQDCLELIFAPGTYTFSSLTGVRIRFSLVMSAPEGGVTFSCEESVCASGITPGASDDGADTMAMMAFEHTGVEQSTFVHIEGIDFRNCSRKLQFDEVDNVSINNCSFVRLLGSALDLLNVRNIEIRNSLFEDCVSSTAIESYRAKGGAVSIAYFNNQSIGNIAASLTIDGCNFTNNSALPAENTDGIDQVLNQNLYNGRGGGLAIIPQDSNYNVRSWVTNSVFQHNHAVVGGGVILILTSDETSHDFFFEGCTFFQNSVGNVGGGLHAAALLRNLRSNPTTVSIKDSRFEKNSALYGGGFSLLQVFSQGRGNRVAVENTDFVGNRAESVGAAVMFHTFIYVQSRQDSHFYNFTDCQFSGNKSPGGIFAAGFVNLNFYGSTQFIDSTGPALRLLGGFLVANGNLSFIGNTVTSDEGGALHIQEFGQVMLTSNAQLQFVNNTGRIGSAIVVDVQTSSSVFSELVYNPQCFLIHEDATLPPSQWTQGSVKFSGNTANIGPAVFISHLLHCSWISFQPDNPSTNNFNPRNFSNWIAFDYSTNNSKALSHSDEDPYDPKFYFQTQPVEINATISEEKVWPGQKIPLELNGQDQFGNPTYIIARVSDSRSNVDLPFNQAVGSDTNNTNEEVLSFDPALLPVQPNVGPASINYRFRNKPDLDTLSGEEVTVIIDTPYNILPSNSLRVNLVLTHCRPGYKLKEVNNVFTCRCIDSNFNVLNCEEDDIVLRDGMWAGAEAGSSQLDLSVCPTPYCRCHTVNRSSSLCETLYYQDSAESARQCHPTRNGTLCGRCVNGTGVGVLRENCRQCDSNSYYALAILVISDAIITSAIMFAVIRLNLHFPHSMKGVLFYIQTVYYTTQHFPTVFWDIRKYMLYVSSALGFYFPYDFCLYPGMPALALFGLKFIPSIITLLVAVLVILCTHVTSVRNGRKRVWKAVWVLILLLYAPLFHNCVSLLKCPLVPDSEGGAQQRHWFYDGEVICFKDPVHIFLSTMAIIVLAFLVLLIPAVFMFTIVADSKKVQLKDKSLQVERIMSALTEGYRDSHEVVWWSSWELFRRLLLISIVVSLPGRSVASAFVVCFSFAIHIFFKPYRKIFQNVIEGAVLFNFIVLLLLRSTQTVLDATKYAGTTVPDYVEGEFPAYHDTVVWVLLPFFYSPLLFAFVFSMGAGLYHTARHVNKRLQKKTGEEDITLDGFSVAYGNRRVTTTDVYS